MTGIPDAVVEAAAKAFASRCGCDEPKFHLGYARTAIEAAEGPWREHIATQMLAQFCGAGYECNCDYHDVARWLKECR